MDGDDVITCSSPPSLVTTTVTTTAALSPSLFTQSQSGQNTPLPAYGSTESIFRQNRSLSQNNVFSFSTEHINNYERPKWQVVRNNNNKRKSQNLDSQLRMKLVKTSEVPTTRSNYYSPLAMDADQNEEAIAETTPQVNNKKVDPKPPPVFIQGVMNYQEMISSILTVVKEDDYICRSLANNVVKINPKTIDSYRNLVKFLRSNNIVFHTYQAKQDKAYRVVIRHIHHSVPTSEIKEELEALGFKVRNIINVLKRSTKDPLNLFFVDLEPADNNKKIYEVQYLMHMKISVEPPRKNTSIAQCTRCQNYGHTKAYCTRPYSCVKCGRNHNSSTCIKTRDTPATCALCEGSHPANYKGCTVYQDLQNFRMNQQQTHPRQPGSAPQNYTNNNASQTIPHRRTHYGSYALAARTDINQPSTSQNPQSTNFETNSNNIPENSKVISLATFLNEFKTMFNQLINQNSMIMTMLNTVINKFASK